MSIAREAWNAMYDVMQESELSPESYLLGVELLNHMKKAMTDCSNFEIAILLVLIANTNMHKEVQVLHG